MSCYLFRFLDDTGEPTGFVGMASAESKTDLFDIIDEFGDPYRVQIKRREKVAVCWREKRTKYGDLVDVEDLELSCGFHVYDSEWKPLTKRGKE